MHENACTYILVPDIQYMDLGTSAFLLKPGNHNPSSYRLENRLAAPEAPTRWRPPAELQLLMLHLAQDDAGFEVAGRLLVHA